MQTRRHPALVRYLAKRGLVDGGTRHDDAVELVLDGTLRILCRPGARGTMVFESRLTELPAERKAVDVLLEQTLRFAGERLGDCDDHPAMSEGSATLLLQQHLDAEAELDAFESGLENFSNAIEDWRRQLGVI
ncbi:MAG: hypothetical protein EOO24_02575 [Comamonadaceae bacterium]|nr:MAG: hypothetical protein EOO24_02575 [Comamonadaceae bacterium]